MGIINFSLDTTQSCAACSVLGVLVHILVLRKGEWNLWSTKFIRSWAIYEISLPFFLIHAWNFPFWDAIWITNAWFGSFITGMTSSILIYRAFFHRLRHFPGPFLARLSNLYITYLTVDQEHLYLELQQMHQKYGDIVRIGPTELSIARPDAFRVIHAVSSPVSKGTFYDIAHPWTNLLADRDKKSHAHRRKAWDRAFTAKSLRGYEHRVVKYANLLIDQIDNMKGKAFNLSTWINFYTFDIMGDLAFGKSFDMLSNGVEHKFYTEAHLSEVLIGAFRRLIWLFPIFQSTPILNRQYMSFQAWLKTQVDTRRQNKPPVPDVFSFLLEDYDALEKPTPWDHHKLCGDAHLIVIAGSDTTSSSTTCLLWQLATHPEVLAQLRTEIDEYKASHEESDLVSLSKLRYLQACIDESLRLYPVVPSGLQRMTPPEGLQIDDVFLPGDTMLVCPSYTMYRDERCFARPNEFVPERWTTKPELVKDASVYAPFSVGRDVCAGKQLGLMEMRYVLTELLSRYEFDFAPGQKPEDFINGLRDCFTLELPKLNMVFTPRG
ncbi:hypothetical protein F53441_9454 [Fusarium austroafricanum]|uniref:Cytochrome P450 n=1 Tax=Fusarium austroafricanum TaxID=2364996 RepID=A0A8H4KCU3_9HYPO|nr:hypothetical protein F53441_9454 [Fusarium austroafricanum]